MSNAYNVVRDFEVAIAEYTGAPYAVSVESCSSALLLSCLYRAHQNGTEEVTIPKITYPSAANALVFAGFKIKFDDRNWQKKGFYEFKDIGVIDSAKLLSRGMYESQKGNLVCLSFHGKKCLKIGRGGAILCPLPGQVSWFKCARFDGRHERPLPQDKLEMPGFNMYLQPEQAARGLEQLQWIKDVNLGQEDEYNDLSQYKFYTEANR